MLINSGPLPPLMYLPVASIIYKAPAGEPRTVEEGRVLPPLQTLSLLLWLPYHTSPGRNMAGWPVLRSWGTAGEKRNRIRNVGILTGRLKEQTGRPTCKCYYLLPCPMCTCGCLVALGLVSLSLCRAISVHHYSDIWVRSGEVLIRFPKREPFYMFVFNI